MDVPLNDLKRGYLAHAEELMAAAERVLTSGWYVHGQEHASFEREFAQYVGGTGHDVSCVGVGNGTDALEIALRSLDLPSGSVVVTAANAGMYSSTAIRRAGLTPRYVDIDPDTMLLTAPGVEAALDADVSVVVVTHLYGRLGDMSPLVALCADRGVTVVEDCAQAVGAKGETRRAGAIGDVAAFSFYPTKNLGALGDGGAVVSRRPEVAERARQLRQYGWSAKYAVATDGGRNSRLDELQAAFLRVRLPYVDADNSARRRVVARYVDAATGTGLRVLPAESSDHVAHLAVAVCENRDAVRAALLAAGVRTDVHYPIPDHLQAPFQGIRDSQDLPVTEAMAQRVLSLPCFPELTDDEVSHVCSVLATL